MPVAAAKPRASDPILAQARSAAELDEQQPHAAHHVQRQQHDQAPFGRLDQRLVGKLQEAVERRRALQRLPKRPEVQRQEQRQAQARQAVHQEGPVRRVRAGALVVAALHAATTTAKTRPQAGCQQHKRQAPARARAPRVR